MRLLHRTWLVSLAVLVSCPVLAGQRISGVVFTEGNAHKITVRAWAVGQALVAKPPLADAPLAELTATPANGFGFELPDDALPVRVEVTAPGHLGAAFTVALPAQAGLPPLWLPAGSELRIRVLVDNKPATGARIWGLLQGLNRVDDAGRWQPVVPSTEVDGKGQAKVWVPAQGTATLSGWGTDGRWGMLPSLRLPALGVRVLRLDSRPTTVLVRTSRGDPAVGILVADRNAPPGTARVTDEKGKVTVQAAGTGDIAVTALGGGYVGTLVRHTPPTGEVTLTLEPVPELIVQWSGTRAPVLFDPAWIPSPLRGGAPLVARGGRTKVSFIPGGGTLTAWGVGVASQVLRIQAVEPPVALHFAPAATVEGNVVEAEDAPVAAVPVWCAQAPPLPGGWHRLARARRQLERPLLPWAVSGSGGAFNIADLAAGPLRLTALKPGAPPADSGPLTLAAGGTARVTLRLVKGTWLALQVVDSEGRVLPGVSAHVFTNEEGRAASMWRSIVGSGASRGEPIAGGTSDSEGALRLQSLPSGPLGLELILSGYVTRWLDVELPAGGKDLGPQVLEPGATVSGRVVDERGQGVADADVYASAGPWGGREFGPPAARSDPLGNFAIADRPRQGKIFLEARSEGLVMSQPVKVVLPPPGPVELRVSRARALEGHVLDERSTEPVRGARVSAARVMQRTIGSGNLYFSRGGAEGETDEAGLFRLEALEAGNYTVTVTASGYKRTQVEATVPEEGQPKVLTVALKHGVAIRGRVVDAQEAPAGGLDVYANPAARQTGTATAAMSGGSARTGSDGSFLIEGLETGRYEVLAEDETGAQAREMADAGGTEEVVLRLQSPGALDGTVVSSDRTPVAGAKVMTMGPSGMVEGERTTDVRGSFAFEGLPPGRYMLMASDEKHASARQQVTVEASRTVQVELAFKPGGVVVGTVRGLSPEELNNCQVFSDAGISAYPAADGNFRLEGVPVGVSRVTAFVLSSTKQRSAPVDLKDLDTPVSVTLDFSNGITLTGSVRREGRPAQGIGVQAQPVGQGTGSGTVTDQDGQFEIKGLDPGQFVVSALDDQGRTLVSQRVTATTDTRVDLVVPGGSLAGRVTDASSGSPVAEATVRATPQGEGGQGQVSSTDDAGSFAFHELADGAFVVRAEAPGYSPGEAQAVVSRGQARDASIALQPEQHLTLIVRDADGSIPDQIFLTPMREGQVSATIWVGCDRDGRAVITTLAAGVYTLRVGSWQGSAINRAAVPGPDLAVQLSPNGTLVIAAPPGSGAWRVRLVTGGLVVPTPSWQGLSGGEWAEIGSAGLRLSLPAAIYTAEIVAPDGTAREQQVGVPPGGEAMIRPEGP
jgi:5-hydroxyisourate hydrolase-like protein (transthyretin family)